MGKYICVGVYRPLIKSKGTWIYGAEAEKARKQIADSWNLKCPADSWQTRFKLTPAEQLPRADFERASISSEDFDVLTLFEPSDKDILRRKIAMFAWPTQYAMALIEK